MSSSSVYQSILKKGEEKGEKREALTIVRRLLARKLGIVPAAEMLVLEQLPHLQLEELTDAIFDFTSPADLQHWLSAQQVH